LLNKNNIDYQLLTNLFYIINIIVHKKIMQLECNAINNSYNTYLE